MSKLSAKRVQALKDPGMYGDGAGLYLNVAPGGTKSWILRVRVKGKTTKTGSPLRKEVGLGGLDTVSLAEARTRALALRSAAKAGHDPSAVRDNRPVTFEAVATQLHAELAPNFRNEKHRADWISSLSRYAFPRIGTRSVAEIERRDIMEILTPIWGAKHETASRVRQRLEAVFDHAIARGFRDAHNPVDSVAKRALAQIKGSRRPIHHEALDWRDVPAFMAELADREAMAALCLRFIVLTAARSGEARMATWSEIDLDNRTWVVPGARMKAGDEHRVPLSDPAIAVLECVRGMDNRLVFPSPQGASQAAGKPLSINAFRPLFQRMGREGLTAHGFRSSFRDWCAEKALADRQLAEAALAHKVGGVEGAYFRSDLFERRRALMDAWGRFSTGQGGEVVELVRA